MSFYTNVKAVGSQIFLRGVDDIGERFQKKVRYSPTLFVPVKEETKYKTLEGINTKPINTHNDGIKFMFFLESEKNIGSKTEVNNG